MNQRLLILDDDPMISKTIVMIADSIGFESRSTTDPTEFFRLLASWQPSHIALDLVMPKMDGVQVMVKLAEQACRARIIITSGMSSRVLDAAGRSAAEHGLVIAGILSKPFTPTALRALLKKSGAGDAAVVIPGAAVPPQQADDELTPDALRQAISDHQLVLAYQPQVSSDECELAGFEALVRWQPPDRGMIMPDRFIPMAESCGLINDLTDQVFDIGLEWLARAVPCNDVEGAGITLSINISAAALTDRDFVEDALHACARHGVDPGRVILELTESSAMRDPTSTLDQLTRMRMKGFQLSIDDFGTGFSSMLQLARLPFSELKVDKSFVMNAMHSVESRVVIRSVVDLGNSLGLRTVAEGVEDAATLEFLEGIGCTVAQGYFISKPLPADKAASWAARRPTPATPVQAPPENELLEAVTSFQWGVAFITGIEEVDRQHKQLVDLINRFSQMLLDEGKVSMTAANRLFAELIDYTSYHFREEEALMAELGLDPRHTEFHHREHGRFIKEVTRMRESAGEGNIKAFQEVLAFLVHWLGYHILGVDQSMARQEVMIRQGSSPETAFMHELDQVAGSTEPLVRALHGLLQLIAQKNEELREHNRKLEARVAERTEALGAVNRQLAAIAMTDALTGIPNRRHAMTMIQRAWDDSRSGDTPLACLMIDADYLKPVNDEYGHDAGDEVIKSVANKLCDAARSDDIVCRLGGDEFIVIAPATPLDGALLLAEKLRSEVSDLRVPVGTGEWQGSISIGVAVLDEEMTRPEDLIKAADDGIYAAKGAGRNKIAVRGTVVQPTTDE